MKHTVIDITQVQFGKPVSLIQLISGTLAIYEQVYRDIRIDSQIN